MGSLPLLLVYACAVGAEPAPLHLSELLREARDKNPDIRAERAEAKAAELSVSPAGALEDPKLMVQLWNAPVDFSTVPVMVQVEQMIPLGGKRGARTDAARAQSRMRVASAEARTRDVEALVKKAYFDLFMADRTLEVDLEIERTLIALREAAGARVASGKGEPVEQMKAESELLQIEADLERIGVDRSSASATLLALLDRDPAQPLGPTLVPAIVRALPALAEIEAGAKKSRPELRMSEAMIAEADANARLADIASIPDVGVFAGEMHAFRMPNVADFLFVGFEINLPVFSGSKYGALAEAAGVRVEAAKHRRRALENQISAELGQAYARVRSEERLIEVHHRLIPLAHQTLESATASYIAGRAEFLTVLDSERELQMHEIDLAMHLGRYEQALADLEHAAGADLGLVAAAEAGHLEQH